MKKILILGTGAQGSTVARRLDEHPNVGEIICADYDKAAVDELVSEMKKAKGVQVNANNQKAVAELAKGADLLVNALPLDFAKTILDAALEAKVNYQDFAAGSVLPLKEGDDAGMNWINGIKYMYEEYGRKFAENGKLAIIGTGSAPGFILVAARKAIREVDTCDTINMMVYEGLEAERFLPFWWSPVVALGDMSADGAAFINGKHVRTEGFSLPLYRKFPETGEKTIVVVEHAHDEPVYVGFNSDTFFKGVKNAYFKYGGVGIDFALPLRRAGLLSKKLEKIGDVKVKPFDVILAHIPHAPKFKHEIQEIIDEGIKSDDGATVVEVIGKKDGKDVQVEAHIFSLGLIDAFEKSGLTAEMYLTGQGGYLFSKMFVEDKYNQKGLISSDMLSEEQVDYYLKCAEDLEIQVEISTKEL